MKMSCSCCHDLEWLLQNSKDKNINERFKSPTWCVKENEDAPVPPGKRSDLDERYADTIVAEIRLSEIPAPQGLQIHLKIEIPGHNR